MTEMKENKEKNALLIQKGYFYTPSHIANFFLRKPDHDIDNLKLNKLVYIAFGWSYAILSREIFNEPIQAWRFGPVIPSLYHEFKYFRSNVIDCLSSIEDIYKKNIWEDIDGVQDNENIIIEPRLPEEEEGEKKLVNLLQEVYDRYSKKYTALELVSLTHGEGTPWANTIKKSDFAYNAEIEKKEILDYYEKKKI